MSEENKSLVPTKSDKRFFGIEIDPVELGNDSNPMVKILTELRKTQDSKAIKLAFEVDPVKADNTYSSVYKRKTNFMPTAILKRIRDSEELIGGVILPVRAKQSSLFARPRANRFDIGFTINLKPESIAKMSESEQQKLKDDVIPQLRDILLNCGRNEGVKDRDKRNLSQTFVEIIEDLLTFGAFAIEVRKDGLDKFHSFRARDAGTIYFTTPQKGESQEAENIREAARVLLKQVQGFKDDEIKRFSEDEYTYVQVIEDVPRQVFTDKELLYWTNTPSTDINRSGYPVSPIERIISAITTHLNLTTHNKLYFVNGRAARNVIVFKSNNLEESDITSIKSQIVGHINSANAAHRMPVFGMTPEDTMEVVPLDPSTRDMEFQYLADLNKRMIFAAYQMSPDEVAALSYLSRGTNSQSLSECLHYDTCVITLTGMHKIGNIVADGVSEAKIWNGHQFVNSKIFKTDKKKLVETILETGQSIKTSPDHYFRIINNNGELDWKPQALLAIGDRILTNRTPIDGVGSIPKYNGRSITPELMETLGWAIGDGTFVAPKPSAGAYIRWFYHHSKEREIWNNHYSTLKEFGLFPIQKEKILSVEEREEIKAKYGFKSVAASRICTYLYDTQFFNWLNDLGFMSSNEGKEIPAIVHTLPVEYRQAFLRGLFSAAAHVSKTANGQVTLTVTNDILRSQVRSLLMTLGIRTIKFEGSSKEEFYGSERRTVRAHNKLSIKDKRAFFNTIGFLQDHKQPKPEWIRGNDPRFLPKKMQEKYIQMLLGSDLPHKYKSGLYQLQNSHNNISIARLSKLCGMVNLSLPEWVESYHFDQVSEIVDHNEYVEMYDVTMYDDSHAFIANGIVVHNSNNEWKLVAARDTGLRPILLSVEDFLNSRLLPQINPEWSKLVQINLEGLDADSPEREATRLQQDSALFLTMNDIMERVEKDDVQIGGNFPLNSAYMQILEKYYTKGQILKALGGPGFENADKDPNLAYPMGDQAWFSFQQMRQQSQMMQQQQTQQGSEMSQELSNGENLDSALAQLGHVLNKNESNLPTARKELLKRHKYVKSKIMKDFEKESKEMMDKIMEAISGSDSKKE